MTITNQDLIDAAKAIGIEVHDNTQTGHLPSVYFFTCETGLTRWNPEKNKSQLMDLLWKLKLDASFNITVNPKDHGGGEIVRVVKCSIYDVDVKAYDFNTTFESFAEAIILAAAEHYRSRVKKDE